MLGPITLGRKLSGEGQLVCIHHAPTLQMLLCEVHESQGVGQSLELFNFIEVFNTRILAGLSLSY